MEWVWIWIAVVVVVVVWRLTRVRETPGRPPRSGSAVRSVGPVNAAAAGVALAVPPLPPAGSGGLLHPDNPDGAFMDGYAAGRFTERWEQRSTAADSARASRPEPTWAEVGDEDDEALDNGSGRDEWGGSRSNRPGASARRSHDVWSDPDDAFHDDSSDDW